VSPCQRPARQQRDGGLLSASGDLRQKAIALLARREHTRVELVRKLAAHGTTEEIEAVIVDLQSSQLQSDARFADAYLRSRAARVGTSRLRQTLRQKGVDAETASTQLAAADLPDEATRARELWVRKFGTAPADAREWAKQARFLQSRGFASDVIRRLLKDPEGVE
jgi:regulatory protein